MFLNIISILTCNRYDFCFNAVAHIYNVFLGIINTYHPVQNIWKKVKKSWLTTSIRLQPIWVFSNTFLFPKIFSFKSLKVSVSKDIMVLICQVILYDHIIIGSYDFMGRSVSSYHPCIFCTHRHTDSEDIAVLDCHMISQDHVIYSYDFIARSSLK